tara:strand:+ start:15761 stop:17725 length:1965 start_codon:yes stop_codon:yes gene_type:complete
MKKKILIKGPLLSRSGYGEQSRIALRALRSREDLFDIYIMNIPWGSTGFITQSENDEIEFINQKIMAAVQYSQGGGNFDLSLQITIPNEFEKIATTNIGFTAGIETTRIAGEWIEKCNMMVDKIITISEHSKKVLQETSYTVKNQETGQEIPNWKITTPVEVINYPYYDRSPVPMDIEFSTTKNFLCISQWAIRKNLENTIRWFVEEFKDDSDAGLVLKTNTASDCYMDREHTSAMLFKLLSPYPERKCKVYLIHGELEPEQLTWLYQHPTMKALINVAHGEGYGLPLFEAAYNGLPLITITWSGQMDFICKPNKKGKRVPLVTRVDYDLKPVHKEAVWKGVIPEDSMWAYAREASYKRALRSVVDKEKHSKSRAKTLQKYIVENFSQEKIYHQFAQAVYGEELVTVANEDLPKISIITSVYDGDDFIRPFLDDMVNQTIFDKCELILIDANSPGNEEDTIREYTQLHDNIIYKKLDEDPGIYGTWNEALSMATGEYITNANLDDRKSPQSLERHAKELYAHPEIGLVYADSFITNAPNETFEQNTSEGRRYNFEQFSREAMLRGNQPHNNPMWRKSLHDTYGTFESKYRSAGDWEFFLRCAFGGENFKKLGDVLGLYYFNPKGISTNFENFEWKQEEESEIYNKYKTLFDTEN